ncbi:uncharacterized protein BX663DRAFT_557135 [Cokeromyces recurvatus]|uniref:uncharacterized protein n=1 Tax=Cokeromyces recurvatus TaxID=90255 RepID=UPI00221EF221|nr:uncharacterized protein BX663DRAFT_557135 [Cokeromyces recurvatus]KAI7907923.1 hypothetical protein BX663DRAFT_557135 [Cokeromyces recurvatus]
MNTEEYEEEISYVEFDLHSAISNEYVEAVSHEGGCSIIGLEEGRPYLQIGEFIFQGNVDESIGTHLLFEINEKTEDQTGLLPLLTSMRVEDGQKQQRYTVRYACSTEKLVTFDNVRVKENSSENQENNNSTFKKIQLNKQPATIEDNYLLTLFRENKEMEQNRLENE